MRSLRQFTFRQLERLQSPENIIKVTQRYHRELQSRWTYQDTFMVSLAEELHPDIADRYKSILAFIRGDWLQKAMFNAAKSESIQRSPGEFQCYATFPAYEQHAHHKAALLVMHSLWNGAHAEIRMEGRDTVDPLRDKMGGRVLNVYIETTHLGAQLLRYKPVDFKMVKNWCDTRGLMPEDVLPWLMYLPDREPAKVVPMRFPSLPYVAEMAFTFSSRCNSLTV